MEFWLDTTDEKIITEATGLGILSGVTTNPSILSKEQCSPETSLRRLLDIQPGYVAAQVLADDVAGMIKQAEKIAKLSSNNRMIIKIPASQEGFKVMALLRNQGIATLATTVFETKQLILSSFVGAHYIAPYLGRINNVTGNALDIVAEMQAIIRAQQNSIKIMAAAIQTAQQVCDCARIGVSAITVPVDVYKELFSCSAPVYESLDKFKADWQRNTATATADLFS